MKLKVRSNLDDVERDLDRIRDDAGKAIPRTLSKLGDQAAVVGVRVAAKGYGINVSDLRPYVEVLVDFASNEVTVQTKGKGFPLRVFKARQTRQGVTFKVKGKQVTIPHAFFVSRLGQFFARGKYGVGGPIARRRRGARKDQLGRGASTSLFRSSGEGFGHFAFGLGRFPITLLRSASPPDAMNAPDVLDAMQQRVDEQAGPIFKRELAAIRRGF